jgi:two-component sensor histidine kinase
MEYNMHHDQTIVHSKRPQVTHGASLVGHPMRLIVKELISNTLKHAFPNARRCEISVERVQGEDGNITLAVSDDGIGTADAVDFEKPATLGIQLVNLLSQQLKAKVDIRRSNPMRFELRFAP